MTAHGCEVVFDSMPDVLAGDGPDEDMAFIRLADGTRVEVGWYPGPGGPGHFKVVHYRDSWHDPLAVVRVGDAPGVARVVGRLAMRASATRPQDIDE